MQYSATVRYTRLAGFCEPERELTWDRFKSEWVRHLLVTWWWWHWWLGVIDLPDNSCVVRWWYSPSHLCVFFSFHLSLPFSNRHRLYSLLLLLSLQRRRRRPPSLLTHSLPTSSTDFSAWFSSLLPVLCCPVSAVVIITTTTTAAAVGVLSSLSSFGRLQWVKCVKLISLIIILNVLVFAAAAAHLHSLNQAHIFYFSDFLLLFIVIFDCFTCLCLYNPALHWKCCLKRNRRRERSFCRWVPPVRGIILLVFSSFNLFSLFSCATISPTFSHSLYDKRTGTNHQAAHHSLHLDLPHQEQWLQQLWVLPRRRAHRGEDHQLWGLPQCPVPLAVPLPHWASSWSLQLDHQAAVRPVPGAAQSNLAFLPNADAAATHAE